MRGIARLKWVSATRCVCGHPAVSLIQTTNLSGDVSYCHTYVFELRVLAEQLSYDGLLLPLADSLFATDVEGSAGGLPRAVRKTGGSFGPDDVRHQVHDGQGNKAGKHRGHDRSIRVPCKLLHY